MTQTHPITPPPGLVQQWRATPEYTDPSEKLFLVTLTTKKLQYIATQAARWGADQELEECIEWLGDAPVVYNDNNDLHPGSYLRDARRLPAPSLKEQALEALQLVDEKLDLPLHNHCNAIHAIRRALEALDD